MGVYEQSYKIQIPTVCITVHLKNRCKRTFPKVLGGILSIEFEVTKQEYNVVVAMPKFESRLFLLCPV